jgi:hypothetical protein
VNVAILRAGGIAVLVSEKKIIAKWYAVRYLKELAYM